jgi:UDPglucose 6-dehydrogenase
MKITMIGTGYVGLVSGVCFSDFGHDVVCVDKDPRKIEMLNAGEVPIYEPGLDLLMAKNVEAGRLSFTTDLPSAVADADAIFIAVGTPTRRGDGHADLTYVMAAAEEVASALTGYAVIVTKSTVPVGTNRKVKQTVAKANPTPSSTWPRTRNSCAKVRPSTISCVPTALSSASRPNARPRSWRTSTARFSCAISRS